jgi:hypothetical protein
MSEERKKILEMVECGRISAEEGVQLLGLVTEPQPPDDGAEVGQGQTTPTGDDTARPVPDARRYWVYPLWGGALLMVLGGAVISGSRSQERGGGWTWLCGWAPLVLGVLVVTLSVWARTAHWMHLSVKDKEDHISLSFPVPLRLGGAVLRLASHFVPQLRGTIVDEAVSALQDELDSGQPVSIEVQDEEEGEQVHIEIH